MDMKKIVYLLWICGLTFAFSACHKTDRERAEQRMENTRDSVNRALDHASDKAKDAWHDTKEGVKEGYDKTKREVEKTFD